MAANSRASKNIIYSRGQSSSVMPNISYSAKKASAGKDIGKKGKNFAKIEAEGDKKYGKGHGAKIAGSVLKKLRAKA